MKLSDIPIDQIKVGTTVVSAIGVPGEVILVSKNPLYADLGHDAWEVSIRWVNGQITDPVFGWMLEDIEVSDTNC